MSDDPAAKGRSRNNTYVRQDDPLGYDTSDPRYPLRMARDALTGVNEEAVDAELARVRKRLGLPPKKLSRWCRLRRWLSHRYWRWRYWREDRRRRKLRR